MLRTNTKKAKNNVRNWIITNADPEFLSPGTVELRKYYTELEKDTLYRMPNGDKTIDLFSVFAADIFSQFYKAMLWNVPIKSYLSSLSYYERFRRWISGGCGVLPDIYLWYHCDPVEILGDILEETEEERKRYTLEQAANKLTHLIYREITQEINKQRNTNYK